MTSAPGRHIDSKFRIGNAPRSKIDGPFQSTSLYQKCSSLRGRLLRIRGFMENFPDLVPLSQENTDPVNELWEIFRWGSPLCYIFNQLPAEEGFKKIEGYALADRPDYSNLDRAKKRAIALFAMETRRDMVVQKIPDCELFTVTDIWDRSSTDGLVKAVNTVTAIIDYLPQAAFEDEEVSQSPLNATNVVPLDTHQNKIIREMLETERRYVHDLEILQKYSNALSQANVIDQDTIHQLFPNLNNLLNFQRKFLIRLELTERLPMEFQRWGQIFLEHEQGFSVYEAYCVNYKRATELMLDHEQSLSGLNYPVDFKTELPNLLLKPIQRVCQYPLLLDSLVKAFSSTTYDHHYELVQGSEAAKRVIKSINESQRRTDNLEIVGNLYSRVSDWRGSRPDSYGELILHDVLSVTKSGVNRIFLMFLFEKVMLICKEVINDDGGSKVSKNINKTLPTSSSSVFGGNTPLRIKGRVFISVVVSAGYLPEPTNTTSNSSRIYPCMVTWKRDDGAMESMTIQFNREEQMKQWQKALLHLINPHVEQKTARNLSRTVNQVALVTPPPPQSPRDSTIPDATLSWHSDFEPDDDEHDDKSVQQKPDNADSEFWSDEDDLEEYLLPSYPPSGRETPIDDRRLYRSRSLPSRFRSRVGESRTQTRESTAGNVGTNLMRGRNNSLPALIASSALLDPPDSDYSASTPLASKFSLLDAKDHYASPLRRPIEPPSLVGAPIVKLKLHFQDDIFIFQVLQTIGCSELMEKIEQKLRLCGPRNPDMKGPLRVKYRDEDGDMVSLISNDDVQMAFEHCGAGKQSQVVLFVV